MYIVLSFSRSTYFHISHPNFTYCIAHQDEKNKILQDVNYREAHLTSHPSPDSVLNVHIHKMITTISIIRLVHNSVAILFHVIFIEQFRASWPWSVGVLESWLSMSSSSEVPASSFSRFLPLDVSSPAVGVILRSGRCRCVRCRGSSLWPILFYNNSNYISTFLQCRNWK